MIQKLLISTLFSLSIFYSFGTTYQPKESLTPSTPSVEYKIGTSAIHSEVTEVADNSSVNNLKKSLSEKITRQNYKGFLDIGYTFGTGDLGMDRLEILTSHGFQLNPYIFTGLGTGFDYFSDEEAFNIPIFANVRGTCILDQLENIIPFLDLKLGYSLGDIKGLYLSPSVGCSFKIKSNFALNTSLGFVFQQCKYHDEYDSGSEFYNGFCLRFGIEF